MKIKLKKKRQEEVLFMRMNRIINNKIKDFRQEVRLEYKFSVLYPGNKPMENRLEECYQYTRGFFNALYWHPQATYHDICIAHKKLTYEYMRLKSVYLPHHELLVNLEFLKQVIR